MELDLNHNFLVLNNYGELIQKGEVFISNH